MCAHAASIKDAVLSGISLEDDDREEFNKIQQVCSYAIWGNQNLFFSWAKLIFMLLTSKAFDQCYLPLCTGTYWPL